MSSQFEYSKVFNFITLHRLDILHKGSHYSKREILRSEKNSDLLTVIKEIKGFFNKVSLGFILCVFSSSLEYTALR